jgi:hypothetical protein
MTLLTILLILVIAGVILWGLKAIPMDDTFRNIARVVLICGVLIYFAVKLLGNNAAALKNIQLW